MNVFLTMFKKTSKHRDGGALGIQINLVIRFFLSLILFHKIQLLENKIASKSFYLNCDRVKVNTSTEIRVKLVL